MNISDEKLSAYLDGELSTSEMTSLDAEIGRDPELADRLAALGTVDRLVRDRAGQIDAVPMPEAVTGLLQPDNVVSMSWWRRVRAQVREHTALAAGLALAIGFGAGQLLPGIAPDGNDYAWEQVTAQLDSVPSGNEASVADGTSVMPRFTFRDHQERYCRQFMLESGGTVSENVACREGNTWELVASARIPDAGSAEEYRVASGPVLLDSALDSLMQGDALTLEEERALLRQW